ncbi:3-oxoacyl-[acyl-carrier-protein] reductase [Chryseomicrobium sp. FSL W7-1435]|uniref:3-oxoacyl-[acyl-carrier-protein] reductase n=1 Tax=Chryseomicrobium sp. FSL W7-1435 TaxID=2921704 RepID=UPI003159C19B
MTLQGKTAVVTGASRGIGSEIAKDLAARGAQVVVNYSGSQEKAEAVVAEIVAAGGKAIAVQASVSNGEEVTALMKAALDEYGSIDILVNNAGITRDNLLMRMKDSEWDDVIDTNLKGVFLTTKAVSRQMIKQRKGRIINISSIVGASGNPGQTNYVAAKAGVVGMTKSVALELASRNITVNAIAPGFIETEMTDQLPEEIKTAMLSQIPLGHFGTSKDIAAAVAFLASDEATYITGQTLHVNGGMYM